MRCYRMSSHWLTRPTEDSAAFAAELAARGVPCLIAPVMEIEPVAVQMPADLIPPQALLLTSRHAAQALAALPATWRDLPTYCVGEATARAAHAQGFTQTIAGAEDVLALLPRLVERHPAGTPLLYLAGEETRVDVVTLLASAGITVTQTIAYRAEAVPQPNPALGAALRDGTLSSVSFFSPRSATLAIDLLTRAGLAAEATALTAYCLSLAVASAAAPIAWKRIISCPTPTRQAMLTLIQS